MTEQMTNRDSGPYPPPPVPTDARSRAAMDILGELARENIRLTALVMELLAEVRRLRELLVRFVGEESEPGEEYKNTPE